MALRWKKMYGQHLLHDKNILKKIAAAVGPEEHETVVEIGCGSGALTRFLVESPAAVVGIEIDEQFYPVLDELFGGKPNFRLVRGDVLDVDPASVFPASGKAAVTGNLPYNLTSQILFRLFGNSGRISRIVVLVQKEVAQRIAAPAGGRDRGLLSVVSGFHADTKILFSVSRNCFFPKPKVDSAVVALRTRRTPENCDPAEFFALVKNCFGKRRKTLRNTLGGYRGIPADAFGETVDLGRRPEELGIEEWAALTRIVQERGV